MIEDKEYRVMPLLKQHTAGCKVLVELGAGIFRLFRHYHDDVETKIGIEMCQTYIDNRDDKDAIAIQGDVRNFDILLGNYGFSAYADEIDVITIIDVLEHLDKNEALDLLKRAQGWSKRILAFTPLGFDEQHGVDEYTFKRTGLAGKFSKEQRDLAIELQRHKSGWEASDFETLGFQEIWVDKHYHKQNEGAIWARWDRE